MNDDNVNQPDDGGGSRTQPVLKPQIQQLIDTYLDGLNRARVNRTPIHADEIASRVAKFYELIRKVVDWKEDNVLRRSAIERILKRLLFTKIAGLSFTKGITDVEIAEIVTNDLIRGGHLPNDEIPRELIPVFAASFRKYLYILEHTEFNPADPLMIKNKINFYTFIVDVAACEVEEILTNPVKENSIINAMSQMMNERIHVYPENIMSAEEKYTQIYIAVCRTLYDLDDSFITYHLLKFQYNEWHNPDPPFMTELQKHIFEIWHQTEQVLAHPLAKNFNALCERMDTVFTLIGDFLESYKSTPEVIESIISNESAFITAIENFYDKRYITLKKRLLRLAIFSTLSVFISNGFTFFIIEVPLAEIFFEGFNIFTSVVDFVVPTVIMFALVSVIRAPPASNKAKVIETLKSFVYSAERTEYMEIYGHRKKNAVIKLIIGILYLVLTVGMFVFVGGIFYLAKLPITSVIFDTFTIALTVFAAVMIRNKAKELNVDEKTNVMEFLLDMISVPIANIGSYFAAKWKEYNIVAIFFTFVIETPFAIILDFIENWSQFLKERRAELH